MLGLIRKFAQWPWPLLRAVEEEVSNTWAQFRFENNEAINEVNEVPATLIGATTITDGKLVTGNSTATDMQFPVVLFAANEDFTIEGECTINTLNSGGADLLIASWTVSTDPGAHWSVVRIPGTGKWNFWYNGALRLEAATPTGLGKQHVAVTRKDGVMRLYVNGKLEATTTFPAGNTQNAATVPVRMRVNNTTQFINGTRDNLRIAKECLYPVEGFTVSELPAYVRASYSTALASGILAQYGFRRNSLINEAPAAQTAVLTGAASVTNGRVKTTNTNADQYSFPVDYFGAADFTIEFMFKLSANRNATIQILGQAYAGDRVHQENSWNIYYQNNQLGVAFWPDLQLQYLNVLCGSLTVGVDSHIVVERIGGTITVYVNGEVRGTLNFAGPLVVPATHTMTSNNKLPGSTGIFGDREIWNVRVASTALYKGEVKTKPTFPAFPVEAKDPWYQFLFKDHGSSSVYDDVSGRSLSLTNMTLANNRLVNTNGYNGRVTFGEFEVDAGEDFTIELKVNITGLSTSGAMLLGVWNDSSTNNAWMLAVLSDLGVQWGHTETGAGGAGSVFVVSSSKLTMNNDHHVAVTRRNGKVTIFVDGKASGTLNDNSAFYNSTLPVSITYQNTNVWMNGARWDIRLVRGQAKYTADFTPAPLTSFVRRSYTEEEQAKVLRQYTFREGLTTDEIAGAALTTSGSLITNGYLTTTYTPNSRHTMPSVYFGAADFTVEFKINISQKSSYFYVLAQWYGGGSSITNGGNSWGAALNDDMTPGFFFRDGSTQRSLSSTIGLLYNKDHHVVFERVDGVLSIYVDGVLGATATLPQVLLNVSNAITNYATSGVGGYAARKLWDIRIANGAMYKGKIPKLNYLPKPKYEMAIEASAFQVMYDAPIVQEKSDQSIEASAFQVLTDDKIVQEKSDQSIEASIIQVLVKA